MRSNRHFVFAPSNNISFPLQHAIILAAIAAVSTAMPSYIAVPADQIAFVDLSELRVRRVPRQTLEPPPPQHLPQALYQQDYQPIHLQHYQQQRKYLSI